MKRWSTEIRDPGQLPAAASVHPCKALLPSAACLVTQVVRKQAPRSGRMRLKLLSVRCGTLRLCMRLQRLPAAMVCTEPCLPWHLPRSSDLLVQLMPASL